MTNPNSRTDAQDQQVEFNTSAIQVGNKVLDGDEFILITKSRQSSDYKVWSSGDPQQTENMYRQSGHIFTELRQPAATS